MPRHVHVATWWITITLQPGPLPISHLRLSTVAEAGGHAAASGALEANLAEEKAMAQWLKNTLSP
jgi:hypothetical protein